MKEKVDLVVAKDIADRYVNLLKPFCDKIQIAGSVRRKRPRVGDIEIVCIPKTVEVPDGLFDVKRERVRGFTQALLDVNIRIIKGNPHTGKYAQIYTTEKIQIDLFMAQHDNWGFIYMIRTGSSEFSQYMGKRWTTWGYKGIDGHLNRLDTNGKPVEVIPTPTEKSFFNLLGLAVVPPTKRNQKGLPS